MIPELKKQISNLIPEDYTECKIHITFHKDWIQNNVDLYSSTSDSLAYRNPWDTTFMSAVCGKDFVYSWGILKKGEKLKIYFEDN